MKQLVLACARTLRLRMALPVLLLLCQRQMVNQLEAAGTNALAHFNVQTYVVGGHLSLPTDTVDFVLSRHTGTNIDLNEMVQAAAALQALYQSNGFPHASVAFAPEQITNDVVKLNVFQAAMPQIVVSGRRYFAGSNNVATVIAESPATSNPSSTTNAQQTTTVASQKMPEANNQAAPSTQETSTNTGPRFAVQHYIVTGNSVLSPQTIAGALTNAEGAFGTNVTLDGIRAAVTHLQGAYRDRGYVTVAVGLPQQKLTNATVKMQVTEGRLAAIVVKDNRYFSSNNVMRTLPSLHTNSILNGLIFQAELNRANANQDRQIYPVIGPGPDPGTSELTLKVKDRLPLHAKVELNNQSSPGTPDFRINTSAVDNNLWQHEHALGVQYGFSPQNYKRGEQWNFYDQPIVANYSGFYRLPLGNPESVQDVVEKNPGNFGYNEATRKFNLPPPSGRAELNLYASRAAIDTDVQVLSSGVIYNNPGVREIDQTTVQQDLTVNEALGFRLTAPLPEIKDIFSTLSGGLDYKSYSVTDYGTNIFDFSEITRKPDGSLNPPIISHVNSPVPTTHPVLDYLPLAFHYDAHLHDPLGNTTLGLGLSVNLWYDGSTQFPNPTNNLYGLQTLRGITGSKDSSGHWVILNPSFSQQVDLYTNWPLTIRADGQWASEPLISNEQFGAGGVNSVRGYREGDVFGDTGWHVSLEQQTAPYVVGPAYGGTPLTVRGSIYSDFAEIYLLDPQGRSPRTSLWGVGFGAIASIGSQWEARFLFSLPLLQTANTDAYQPFFNFSLTAQF